MKLNTIKKAVEQLLTTDLAYQDKHDAFNALKEVHDTLERATDDDVYKDEVYIISASCLADLMISDLYDVYAKRRKLHGEDFPVSYFQHDARKEFGFEDFTNDQLQIGYDIISDLWQDNEDNGDHDENGLLRQTNDNI